MERESPLVPYVVLCRDLMSVHDVAEILAHVLLVKRGSSILERVEQGEREHLLDVSRRASFGDTGELVAPLSRIEGRVVLLLVEVEGGDVLARLAVRHQEGDLPAEPTGPRQGFVED